MKELYKKDDGSWGLYKHLVRCTNDGVQEEKYDDDLEFYNSFAAMHANFTLDSVTSMTYTPEQLSRLNEVSGIGYEHYDEVYDYVVNGIAKADSKIFAVNNITTLRKTVDSLILLNLGVM